MYEKLKKLHNCIVILAMIQLCNSQNYRQNTASLRKHSSYRYARASLKDSVENDNEKYLKHPASHTLNINKLYEQVSI